MVMFFGHWKLMFHVWQRGDAATPNLQDGSSDIHSELICGTAILDLALAVTMALVGEKLSEPRPDPRSACTTPLAAADNTVDISAGVASGSSISVDFSLFWPISRGAL